MSAVKRKKTLPLMPMPMPTSFLHSPSPAAQLYQAPAGKDFTSKDVVIIALKHL